MESVVNQRANSTVFVLLEIVMMVLRNCQKASCNQHDDELAYV